MIKSCIYAIAVFGFFNDKCHNF